MSAALQQSSQLKFKLSVVKGPHAGQVFQLHKDKMTIGRGPENDVVLMNDPQVSRLHAQLVVIDRDVEIVKISQKNAVLVGGESVERWKLVNGSTFVVGDSEIKIEFELGQAVIAIQQQKSADVIPLKNLEATNVIPNPNAIVPAVKPAVPKQTSPPPPSQKNSVPAIPGAKSPQVSATQPRQMSVQNQQIMQQQMMMQQQAYLAQQAAAQQGRTAARPQSTSLLEDPKARFYIILLLVVAIGAFFFLGQKKSGKAGKAKPVLKYEDEIAIKLNSTPETENIKKREDKKKDRDSAQYLRAQENLVRGMRDFGLGNYTRAQEFFQVVLNLEPDNQLAKRHLMLSKVRFDELVQTKLMLGESYYSKHNFDMCMSMYQQVMNMLDDRRSDSKYKLAERKAKECELANQGIR